MNINLTKQEKDFLFIKLVKVVKTLNDSNKRVDQITKSIRQIKEMDKFNKEKERVFIKNYKDYMNNLR